MGVKLMPLPDDPHVRFAGILPDEERLHAMEAATVVVTPSPHESLSLLALEAFAVGTPVLANGRSEVLVDHCRRSNAGLYYENRWEFVEALKLLTRDPGLRAAMGRNGKAYVNRYYRWDIILSKYERMMARLRMPVRESREPRDSRDSRDSRQGERRQSSQPPQSGRQEGRSQQGRRDNRPGGRPDGRSGGRPGDRRQRSR